jgi:site-specific recombinase XerD
VKLLNTALRSYFAFKTIQGELTSHLAAALPTAAIWRLAQLPKMLTREEIDRLLGAYDRTTAIGVRDYAIARCLIDLGLRTIEVARLRLDDVDWREGVLHITAKGRRVDLLPLPKTTGRAIAIYLRRGRPSSTRRELFVRHRAPLSAPLDSDIVSHTIWCAARRCGLQDRIRGAHILRHTVAGQLVQAGAPLKDIADLLRHRDLDTTTIYAKVDLPALRRVALPWPGRSA